MNAAQELLPEIPPGGGPPPELLLVDDDKLTRAFMASVLRSVGFEVREATRLAEARTLLVHRPDLLILDGLLPDGTGLQFLAELRSNNLWMPVLFVSAFFKDLQSFQVLNDYRAMGVLHKPVDPEDLVNAVRGGLRTAGIGFAHAGGM